jgi:hypothetical protein
MHTLTQTFRNERTAATTAPGCAGRVHSKEVAPGTFSLVRNLVDEHAPSGICYGLGKKPASQSLNVQILNCNRAEVGNDSLTNLVMKIRSLVANVCLSALQKLHGLTSAMRALLPSRNFALAGSETCLRLTIPARILNLAAITQRREVSQANVDTDTRGDFGQRSGLAFDGKANVPFATLALDGDSLDLSLNRTVQLDLDQSNTLHSQLAGIEQPTASAVTRKRDAIEAPMRLETREPCCRFALHASKERLESLIDSAQHILTSGEIRQREIASRSNLFQLICLRVVVDRLTIQSPRIAALLQTTVVKSARLAQLTVKRASLSTCRIHSVLERKTHLSALLIGDVLLHGSLGNVADAADVVASRPQTGKPLSEINKFLPQHPRRESFELSRDVRRCFSWIAFNEQVNVIGHDLHRVNRRAKFLCLCVEQFFQPLFDVA